MTNSEQKYVEIMRSLEPIFVSAGKIAVEMQDGIKFKQKFETGNSHIDIVTEADGRVQEIILEAMAQTDLAECVLCAEEDTPSVGLFNGKAKIFITLDPIDGTKIYAEGGNFYSVIVGLHNGVEPLYTFYHYPAMGWTKVMIGDKCESTGKPDEIELPEDASKSIVCSWGDPKILIPDLYSKLVKDGYTFHLSKELTTKTGSSTLFLADKVAGLFKPNPLTVDGLAGLHFAKTQGNKIYSGNNKGNEVNLSEITKDKHGDFHSGFYLVLK